MKGVQTLAESVSAARRPVAAGNPFLALQTRVSEQIIVGLDKYRDQRDQMEEQIFFGFYGSPIVQALLGLNDSSEVRTLPSIPVEEFAARQARADAYAATLHSGGFDEALSRAVLYVTAAERMIDQRCALALNAARKKLMHLSLAEFKSLLRDQSFVLQLDRERAVEALAVMVPQTQTRQDLLKQVQVIVSAGDLPLATVHDRMIRLAEVLGFPIEQPMTVETSGEM
jgi:hypothetical protein